MTNDMIGPTEANEYQRGQDAWARLRFSVVGPLLAAPPAAGELRAELVKLAAKTWRHPIRGELTQFAYATIERWYYTARSAPIDPVAELRRRVRKDAGIQVAVTEEQKAVLRTQHREHPTWSYQLHYDNLEAVVSADARLGALPSYSTMRRWMKSQGLYRQRRRPGKAPAVPAQPREVRSYEAEYVNGLWHADFHHGSRPVLTRDGAWCKAILFAALDDRSRLCCHAQWYLDEEAESFVHGSCQAFQKRGLPRAYMTDNGAAMRALETQCGLHDLGIVWEPTLPYSPHQNAKAENFWAQVEGRLMPMLEGERELRLELLNHATQAWYELDYNQKLHSEIGTTPIRRFLDDKSVGRDSPDSQTLRRAFRGEWRRTQRRSDGTIPLFGQRYEIPSRYRTLTHVLVRCARWDLSFVHMVDERTAVELCPIHPVDKQANADGLRRASAPSALPEKPSPSGMAPLLRKLMADYAATGLPPAYLPKDDVADDQRGAGGQP